MEDTLKLQVVRLLALLRLIELALLSNVTPLQKNEVILILLQRTLGDVLKYLKQQTEEV